MTRKQFIYACLGCCEEVRNDMLLVGKNNSYIIFTWCPMVKHKNLYIKLFLYNLMKEFLPIGWRLKCLLFDSSFLLEWPWRNSKSLYKPHLYMHPEWFFSHTTGTGLFGDFLAIWLGVNDMLSCDAFFRPITYQSVMMASNL